MREAKHGGVRCERDKTARRGGGASKGGRGVMKGKKERNESTIFLFLIMRMRRCGVCLPFGGESWWLIGGLVGGASLHRGEGAQKAYGVVVVLSSGDGA